MHLFHYDSLNRIRLLARVVLSVAGDDRFWRKIGNNFGNGKAWRPCACVNVSLIHQIGQISSHILPTYRCKVDLVKYMLLVFWDKISEVVYYRYAKISCATRGHRKKPVFYDFIN
jgi:hypothetical protein